MEDCAIPEGPLGWYLRTSLDHLLLVPDLNAAVKSDPVQIMIGGPPARIEGAETLLRQSATGPLRPTHLDEVPGPQYRPLRHHEPRVHQRTGR